MTRMLVVAAGVSVAAVVAGLWLLGLALMDMGADFDPDPYGEEE